MKSILIPSDFSVESAVAFNYAVEIACLSGAKLTLLHAYHIPVLNHIENTGSPIASLLDVTDGIAPDAFTTAVKKAHLPEVLESIEFEYVYTPKLNAKSILELHQKRSFDFIIAESRPQNKFYSWLFGKYTDELIECIKDIPLMIVPKTALFKPILHIAYSTSLLAPNATLINLRNFALLFNAKISLVHIIDEPTRSYPQRVTTFKERAIQSFAPLTFDFTELTNPDIEKTLLHFLQTHQPHLDLVMMIERPKHKYDRLFINNMTQTIANRAPVPVVIFHEPDLPTI